MNSTKVTDNDNTEEETRVYLTSYLLDIDTTIRIFRKILST